MEIPDRLSEILARLDDVKRLFPDRWQASSPLREDKKPSLSIGLEPDQKILMFDHGGGPEATEEIMKAIDLPMSYLFPETSSRGRNRAESQESISDALHEINSMWKMVSIDYCPKMQSKWVASTRQMTPAHQRRLSKSLGLPEHIIDDFEVGFDSAQNGYVIPETNEYGAIIGLQIRHLNGTKHFVKGGKRGLLGLQGLPKSDRMFITEGWTDAAAMRSLGYTNVFARPTANSNVDLICKAIKLLQPREVIIVADPKPQEQKGAKTLGRAIGKFVSCRIITPIAGDTREWVTNGASQRDVERLIADAPMHKPKLRVEQFRLYSPSQIEQFPTPNFLVEGMIHEGNFAVLYGKPKSGKSLVALDLALAIQSGRQWLAGGKKVSEGQVVYVAAEGQSGYKGRIAACRRGYIHANPEAKRNFEKFKVMFNGPLINTDEVKKLIDVIDRDEIRPSLIILDTLARTMKGEENSTGEMAAYVRGIDHLRDHFSCAVMVIHHTPRNANRIRGSSALDGACDVAIRVSRGTNPNTLQLECDMIKDSKEFEPIHLRMQEEGDSLRLVPGLPHDFEDEKNQNSDAATRTLEHLKTLCDKADSEWVLRKDWVKSSGVPSDTFNKHLKRLKVNDLIETHEQGRQKMYKPKELGT